MIIINMCFVIIYLFKKKICNLDFLKKKYVFIFFECFDQNIKCCNFCKEVNMYVLN